jgi:hypothetical protein
MFAAKISRLATPRLQFLALKSNPNQAKIFMPRHAISYSLPLLSNNSATLLVSDPHVDGIEAETNPVIEASETSVQPGKNYMKDDPLYKAFLAENTEEKMDPWKE